MAPNPVKIADRRHAWFKNAVMVDGQADTLAAFSEGA
jgi:hypothetical protein